MIREIRKNRKLLNKLNTIWNKERPIAMLSYIVQKLSNNNKNCFYYLMFHFHSTNNPNWRHMVAPRFFFIILLTLFLSFFFSNFMNSITIPFFFRLCWFLLFNTNLWWYFYKIKREQFFKISTYDAICGPKMKWSNFQSKFY